MTRVRLRWIATLTGAALLVGGVGCSLVATMAVMLDQEPTRDVKAEYRDLADKRIAIFVWAENDTLFEYPHVRLEVATFVQDALTANVPGATVASLREVTALQARDPDWDRTHPARLATRVDADCALMIELTEYTTREPGSEHILRGRIQGNVKVYPADQPDAPPAYRTTAKATHPPDGPGRWNHSEVELRRETMRLFAEDLVSHFHDRKVKL